MQEEVRQDGSFTLVHDEIIIIMLCILPVAIKANLK